MRWNADIKCDKLIRKEATITHHTISPLPPPPPQEVSKFEITLYQ